MTEHYPKVSPPGGSRRKKKPLEFAFKPKPEPPKPTVEAHPDVTQGKKFPCANCGGALKFDPAQNSLTCEYCGHVQDIPKSADQVSELCFETYFEKGEVAEAILAGAEGETRCGSCGASVMMPANVKTEECPFCGGHLEQRLSAPKPVMAPSGLLPFKVEKESAQAHFVEWVRSRWFAPNGFKRIAKLDKLKGMYLPHWTFDSMTYNFYSGQRGDYYYTYVGTGKNRRRQRRTRWTPVEGSVNHFFDDVLVCSSTSLPEKMVDDLEPWDLTEIVPYRGEYLSGFATERYSVSAKEGFGRARGKMDVYISQLVRASIGGDTQRVSSIDTQVDGVTFKYVLLPVWVAAYRHADKVHRILINARTGEVQGERPWSAAKIALTVLAVLAAAGGIALAMTS